MSKPERPPEGFIFSDWAIFLRGLTLDGKIKLSDVAESELIKAFYAGFASGLSLIDRAMRAAADEDDDEIGARYLGGVMRDVRTEVEAFSQTQMELAGLKGHAFTPIVPGAKVKGRGNGNGNGSSNGHG